MTATVARGAGVSHAAPARHLGDKAGMLTAVAVQDSEFFAGYLSTAADRVDSPLEAPHANGRAYLEFSDLYPGHFEIMFRPALISTGDPGRSASSSPSSASCALNARAR